jgi:hypothetical protein
MLRWAAVFLVVGCGGGGAVDSGVLDAGPEPLAECDLVPAEAAPSMAEGGRLVLPLLAKGAVSSVAFDAGALEISANDGGTLTLKAPYGGADAVTLSAAVRCGDQTVERAWPIAVRKMKWTQLKPWQSDVTGPQARSTV